MRVRKKALASSLSLLIFIMLSINVVKADDKEDNVMDGSAQHTDTFSIEERNFIIENLEQNLEQGFDSEEEMAAQEDIICVQLPERIDFRIITIEGYPKGLVDSEEFSVLNLGENGVIVQIDSLYLQVEDKSNFNISDNPQLPDTGNNIYMELYAVCGEMSETIVVSDDPSSTVPFSFYLKSGNDFHFTLRGSANELGNIPWGTGKISIRIAFSIIPTRDVNSIPTIEAVKENEGDLINEIQDSKDDKMDEGLIDLADERFTEEDEEPGEDQGNEVDQVTEEEKPVDESVSDTTDKEPSDDQADVTNQTDSDSEIDDGHQSENDLPTAEDDEDSGNEDSPSSESNNINMEGNNSEL